MAVKSKLLNKGRNTKKPKITRSEAYLVNFKYLGDEPDSAKIKSVSDYARAYSWYGSMASKDDARDYLVDYLSQHQAALVKSVSLIPDNWIPFTAAWNCRIATRTGTKISDRSLEMIIESIKKVTPEEPKDKPKADKPSIQDRIKERGYEIIGDIEELIDKDEPFSLYTWLQKNEIPAMYASKIVEYYAPVLNEFIDAVSGNIDGYENWNKAKLKTRMSFYLQLVEDAERYGSVTKKTRAVRKPRPVSVDKMLKNFKYQKESAEYKLASVDPQKIIGAQELWAFNSKYGIITIFRALDRGGLKVKGTTIAAFDETQSASYKTGRKTAVVADAVAKATKAGLKKVLADLKSNTFNPRINENTILLKVI